jgi:cysteinyl-tRNA synthetase
MLKIYNTLSHRIEEFSPLKPPDVGMYSCGPTVYDYQQIGNMRRYVGDDTLIRVLQYNGFQVHHVMNITDVGHLVSDADTGEDKMEKGAKKFGKSVWDIAKMFEQQFKDSCQELNIQLPKELMHATDFIKEQIALVQVLEKKGFTYKTADGIYFDTSKFPDYFKLSRQNPEELRAGARIEMGEKKNVSDFALWKFSPKEEKRQMEWESPWGMGFPGWHIECSAMSMKALGDTFDIHTGGIDHINIHHTNEIAQSEAVTDKPFVKYWVHHAFLQVEGEKMSKSLGNFYTVQDIIEKGYDPMALRYLYLQTHYRQEMNFTFAALEAAQNALNRLRREIVGWDDGSILIPEYEAQFKAAINDDLNMPNALAVLWEVVRSDKNSAEKLATVFKFDEVLGLSLKDAKSIVQKQGEVPSAVQKSLDERENLRKEKKFAEADKIREKVIGMGYKVEDKS